MAFYPLPLLLALKSLYFVAYFQVVKVTQVETTVDSSLSLTSSVSIFKLLIDLGRGSHHHVGCVLGCYV